MLALSLPKTGQEPLVPPKGGSRVGQGLTALPCRMDLGSRSSPLGLAKHPRVGGCTTHYFLVS